MLFINITTNYIVSLHNNEEVATTSFLGLYTKIKRVCRLWSFAEESMDYDLFARNGYSH